jgi:mycoredoxin
VQQVNGGYKSVPTIIFPDGSVLVEPSNVVLEKKLKEVKGLLT